VAGLAPETVKPEFFSNAGNLSPAPGNFGLLPVMSESSQKAALPEYTAVTVYPAGGGLPGFGNIVPIGFSPDSD
jgi:hypothetical protein